ncbi:exonuclease II Exo2 [Mycoemilia scoparia]|uniref:Exonuclease II Exo2 n=1 Tax=Mycoemilia scoparia TaxID=417184 RepID=A0A9W8A0R5_9FUNG|nr:exonuclease II Exo2 [Mycoemilia scoparia]
MGIPKYFRWLSERYPLSGQLLTQVPEFDGLYLDMNGIIHNCSHPEGKSLTESETFINIFNYIDFVFAKIKPKKVFYMAIDGVAPRAKMNEQRGRRFRAAAERQSESSFDSNCITPGTEFMARLTEGIRYFIVKKVSEDKEWQQPKIIFSGHEVPGEGEHKIVDYIRKHRTPNERHCLYGLDADLIMLGLALHEPHVCLLREEVFRPASIKVDSSDPQFQRFFLFHLSVLRGCLEKEFESLKPFDLERIIDDYVFINMLVGNDFLPTIPDLKIGDDGIMVLMDAYRQIDPPRRGYLHDQGVVNFTQLQRLMRILSKFEVAAYQHKKSRDAKEKSSEDIEDRQGFYEYVAHYYKVKMNIDYPIPNIDEEFPSPPESVIPLCSDYIKTIQWVLRYYFTGMPSWSWFYPHHYAPRIADLCTGLEKYGVDGFELDQPYRPFEQLMSVLPAKSRSLIPQAYRKLMVDADSPIIDFYPEKFDTDLNGKQMPWEAVVLIDFINISRLRAAILPLADMLTTEEQARNELGRVFIFVPQAPEVNEYPSPFPDFLPSISNPRCRMEPFEPKDPSSIKYGILPGTRSSDQLLPGFPSLDTLPHSASFRFHHVRVFLQDSGLESLVVNLDPLRKRFPSGCIDYGTSPPTIHSSFAKSILSKKRVFVEWPYLRDAKPIAVWDAFGRHFVDDEGILQVVEHGRDEKDLWKSKTKRETNFMSKRMAITMEDPIVMIEAHMFETMEVHPGGARTRKYHKDAFLFNLNATIIEEGLWGQDPRYQELCQEPLASRHPLGSEVIYLGKGQNYGKAAVISGYSEGTGLNIDIQPAPSELPHEDVKRFIEQEDEVYYSMEDVAEKCGLELEIVKRLVGSVDVKTKKGSRIDLGLNLVPSPRGKKAFGYSRLNEGAWCFTAAAIDLVKEYSTKFPRIVPKLANLKLNGLNYSDKIFESEVEAESINSWLKNKSDELFQVDINFEGLNSASIRDIIYNIDDDSQKTVGPINVSNVEESRVLRIKDAQYQLNSQHFSIGDRVVNIMNGGCSVQFGVTGFVSGAIINFKTKDVTMVEVVFDEPFIAGSNLNNRCPDFRGICLQPWMLLNITNKQYEITTCTETQK